jgi:2-dehydro-3-deoxyphosphogluconate aldolase/(4S)-4-hydroxy-2-oxoglutarate aldolase
MAQFTRITVAQTLSEQGLAPLFYHPEPEVCKNIAAACYRAGSRLLEFTNRGDFAHEVFGELIKYANRELPGMIIGAGSITDGGTAALFLQLGANFLVSPALRDDVAITCNRRKVMYLPGCGSLTEIGRAEELGCEVIKLFPGSVFSPQFVKDLRGPQPWTSIMPTGGISTTRESLEAWFGAGVVAVGMGSQLISKEILENSQYDLLESRVKEAFALVQSLKKQAR